MRKNVLFLMIVSVLIILVSWTQIGKAIDTQESELTVLESHPRVAVPDYPLDAVFFSHWYREDSQFHINMNIPDDPADAKVFYDKFGNQEYSSGVAAYPDYPLDGKLFMDQYAGLP